MSQIIFNCINCDRELAVDEQYSGTKVTCHECSSPLMVPDKQKKQIEEEKTDSKINEIILTTAPTLEGYQVTETIEVITAECAFGMNIVRDIFASFTDFFGGRSNSTQQVLRDARKHCLYELKKEAAVLGADAVIAIDLDYSEFSGQSKSMLFLVASGTAVRIKKT